ncbi:hypothetical protein KY334_02450 [Candidatus Woesearchaeota archaeon]|nr:hypothetical protein [Candidatus Woesearchaeota archaeon]
MNLEEEIRKEENYIIAKVSDYVPEVVESTHPRFVVGTKFDFGFFHSALFNDNYSVLLQSNNSNSNYTIVERFDPSDKDEAAEAEIVKMSNNNEAVYGKVKETNMDYIDGWWINRKDLANNLDSNAGSYLFKVKPKKIMGFDPDKLIIL